MQPVLCCLCRTSNILFQTRFVGLKFVRANSRLLSCWYLQRRGLTFTSDSCETLSLEQLPSPNALYVCMFSYGRVCCRYCMYCTIVRVCCACLRGGGIHYESLKEADLWNVEVRNSLSGRVRASPLICPYPTKEI